MSRHMNGEKNSKNYKGKLDRISDGIVISLLRKDQKSSKEIEEQMKKLSKIQDNINLLKQKMTANGKGFIMIKSVL